MHVAWLGRDHYVGLAHFQVFAIAYFCRQLENGTTVVIQ